MSQLGISHAGPDRAFTTPFELLMLTGYMLSILGWIGHLLRHPGF